MVSTELHEAARFGDLERVMDLVENKGFNVEGKDDWSSTPLHKAANYGHIKVVRYLVEQAHADVEAKDDNGSTPICEAARNGHLEVVRYLVEQAHAEVEDGWTPLDSAASSYFPSLEVVKYLVEQARVDIWNKDKNGHISCDRTWKPEIREYLKRMMEDGELGLTMTKSAAFNPSKKNKIDEEDDNNKVDNESTIEPAATAASTQK